jgi:2-dehydro-3-deoxy-D-gluconate 5-dehydrogenase
VNNHRFDLTGKTAVVTGASRGIGKAVAVALAQHGADIIGVSSTMTTNSGELTELVEAQGRTFSAVNCDLSDRLAVTELATHLGQTNVDILINNAGITQRTPTLDHTDEMWDRVLQVNLTAPFVLARELGRQMVHRGSGKIVFVGSLWTFQGGLNVVSYTASKHAIAGITKAMANEWASRGVNVNAIAPGFIETDINANLKRDLPERYAFISSRIPQGRWGQAEDIAGAAVYLASPAADYVHGSVLAVDGGWLAG